jgi:hypothetical protein
MEIKIDYYIGESGNMRIMHTTVTEEQIIQMLEDSFRNGELPCPINYDRESVKVEFNIDKVIV